MKTESICLQLTLFLSAILHLRLSVSYELDGGVSFRAKTSFIEYKLTDTSSFLGAYLRLEFSSTKCNGDLLLITSRDTDDLYRISFHEQTKTTFYYRINGEEFEVPVSLPGNQTFCDGRRHSVEFNRYSKTKTVTSKADDGQQKDTKEDRPGMTRISFSKPDKIELGGLSGTKFDGCIYNAIVLFYSSNIFTNISLNVIERYTKEDRNVRSAYVFLGACPGTKLEDECTSSSSNNPMTTERGVITSPRDMEAAKISSCIWSITTSPKRRFKLTFLHYNGSFSCLESHVILYDGTELTPSNILGRFCFPASNKVIYTRGNKMVLDMILPKRHYLDFIAKYESVGLDEGPCPTNRTLKGMSGSLMSPNFPNNYESEQECSWIISVPQGYHVRLFFDHAAEFHIHSCTNKTCDCDFLEVRQGRNSEGKLLGTYCGSTKPSPIYASGSDVWLRFVTDKNSNNKGFNVTFEAIYSLADGCPWNKTLTGHRGYINSPLFALDYPGNMDCIWRIHVTGNHRVAFVFLRPINLDPNCTDVLEIRDGLDASSPLLRRYCSSEPTPQTIFSSGREMYVRFKSDGYNRRDVFRDESVEQGFHATYFVTRVRSDAFILNGSIFTMVLTVLLCTFRCMTG